MDSYTILELRTLCKKIGLRGYSNLTKIKLINLLMKTESEGKPYNYYTVQELKNFCKKKGLQGYSLLCKQELISLIENYHKLKNRPLKECVVCCEKTEENLGCPNINCSVNKEDLICGVCYLKMVNCPLCRTNYIEETKRSISSETLTRLFRDYMVKTDEYNAANDEYIKALEDYTKASIHCRKLREEWNMLVNINLYYPAFRFNILNAERTKVETSEYRYVARLHRQNAWIRKSNTKHLISCYNN